MRLPGVVARPALDEDDLIVRPHHRDAAHDLLDVPGLVPRRHDHGHRRGSGRNSFGAGSRNEDVHHGEGAKERQRRQITVQEIAQHRNPEREQHLAVQPDGLEIREIEQVGDILMVEPVRLEGLAAEAEGSGEPHQGLPEAAVVGNDQARLRPPGMGEGDPGSPECPAGSGGPH